MNSSTTLPSVLPELYAGRVRWELLTPFPELDRADRAAGDQAVASLTALLDERLDPEAVEQSGNLPDGFLERLQDAGLLRLMVTPDLGGLGLSWWNACRVVEAAAHRSLAVAFVLSIHNGFGSASYLPALADGPLRELIAHRVADGIVSAAADAEPAGAANQSRQTFAVPVDDGTAYVLNGEKVYIGNGAVADFLDVSASVTDSSGNTSVRLFFVDTKSPGFEVVGRHEFMGLRGAPFGMLRLTGVRVPAAQLMPESLEQDWRMRPEQAVSAGVDVDTDLGLRAALARHLVIGPPSLAIARRSLEWVREFAGRRTIDGRGLGEYEEIQRSVGEIAAELHTIETVHQWCVLGLDRVNTEPDLAAAKNVVSLAAGRAIDRAVALLGGEGYETARSKAARGAVPHPVERYLRDARALRVAGGVESLMDRWSAELNLSALDLAEAPPAAPSTADSPRAYVEQQAVRFSTTCRSLLAEQPGLFARQRLAGLLGRLASELLTLTVLAGRPSPEAMLFEAGFAAARRRLDLVWADLTTELASSTHPAGQVGARLLDDRGLEATVSAVWLEVLGVGEADLARDFYSLGGHSMVAVRLAARLRERLGVRVPVRVILEKPTVAELVRHLAD
ncbi:phosphopantetheine-binding protein [Kribbella italica]|uniref:Alkylation response protein AidB-like acyl-CoA dehydrogenase/acyl carrier protein n=1 Tax=Kribbella italica TaxID=1540520 RepID=A0A7W9MTC0_9ACTN|nr:phosphopantetheine-binding protein [Kribbella italica]MBB5835636.1 alkylation response protein AidB-like acyl-CoA dehydrogenase/acyl carrier protein [Kribbella italica]